MKLPFRIEQQVQWNHLDALNHVNNAEYFTYFENVRIAIMDHLGYGSISSHDTFGPILAQISCDFIAPLTYPDTISIGCGVTRLGNSSYDLAYDIYSAEQDKLVAKGSSVVVMVDYKKGSAVPIPEDIRKKIEEQVTEV